MGRTTEIVSREILRYLLSHPNARDTLQGIIKWWTKEFTFEEIYEALADLEARGWIQIWHLPSGGTLYGLRTEALSEILSSLARPE